MPVTNKAALPLAGLGVVHAAPNLLQRDDALELAREIAQFRADLIIVDTFAQVTPGAMSTDQLVNNAGCLG
jgi:hypothetical protein